MAITATAGGVSATVKPHRPSLADMQRHYPPEKNSRGFIYDALIKGEFTGQQKTSYLQNTCATRMSYALIKSGFNLPQTADPKGSMKGGDGKWYWIRVNDLQQELVRRFKGFDAELKFDPVTEEATRTHASWLKVCAERKAKGQKFIDTELAGKSGIVVFRVGGWTSASGHFTMWDGKTRKLAFATEHGNADNMNYYFWLTTNGDLGLGPLYQITHVQFWELK